MSRSLIYAWAFVAASHSDIINAKRVGEARSIWQSSILAL
jgi:hypothetical protein